MSFYGIHQTSKCHKRCGEQAEGGGVSQRLLKNKKNFLCGLNCVLAVVPIRNDVDVIAPMVMVGLGVDRT